MLTEEELAAMEARAEAATPGPWRWITQRINDRYSTLSAKGTRRAKPGHRLRETWVGLLVGRALSPWAEEWLNDPAPRNVADEWDFTHVYGLRWNWLKAGSVDGSAAFHDRDREFVAHARADVPALVAEVRRLRGLLVALMEADNAFDRRHGFSVHTAQEETTMEHIVRDPTVRFYRDAEARTFATVTTATEPGEFLEAVAEAFPDALEDVVGPRMLLEELLPQICEVWAKLKGYKAERVFEQRLLIAGEPNPTAHMRLMNPPALPAVNGHDAEQIPAS